METNTFKSKYTEMFEGEYNIYLPNKNEKPNEKPSSVQTKTKTKN